MVEGARDYESGFDPETPLLQDTFSEFSYHYEGGVSHLKNEKTGNRFLKKFKLPLLSDNGLLFLFRFNIKKCNEFTKFDISKKEISDIIIPDKIESIPRTLNFFITKASELKICNRDPNLIPKGLYSVTFHDFQDTSIAIADYESPMMKKQNGSYSIFMYDDPSEPLNKPN